MKKILLTAAFLATINGYSQELDQAYLDSLPEDVRNDVLQQIDVQDEFKRPVYRRPSLMIKKNYCDLSLGITDTDCIERTDRFGDKIFDSMQSSFMPINEPNFDSSYVLDFGDVLEVQLVGQKNIIKEIPIKRDGSINIPEIGNIFISGMSLESATTLIKNKISSAYIGVESFVSLINIRDIQVLVTGNAFNPGMYILNGNANLLHSLSMAGGADEHGSYRQIDLIRNNKIIRSLDLYDIFINGKTVLGNRLRSGDTVMVRPSFKMVRVSGAVKRPGMYELKSDENFEDLIFYANGFADNANIETLRIERFQKDKAGFIEINDISKLVDYVPISSDRLDVRAYKRNYVTIKGAVNSPGTYVIGEGDKLSSLINKADGYTDNAYPFGGILNNELALKLNEESINKLYTSFVKKLITKGDSLFASESLPFILDELSKGDVSGRVMAEFDLSILKSKPALDTTLSDGDEIIIPFQTEQVFLFGELANTGAVRYEPYASITDYIDKSGGVFSEADLNNVYVVHPNGEVNRFKSKFLNSRNNDILIYPGSVIYIPRKVKNRDISVVAAIWAPIVSGLATSITALAVLDNQ